MKDDRHQKREASNLRDLLFEQYVSSSTGVHGPLSDARLERYIEAYRYYLRGWIPAAEGDWLDLGCGQGALMLLAQSYGYSVRGVDISEEMVAQARLRGLSVICGDVLDYLNETPDGSLGVVTAFDIIEHFPKQQGFQILCEIRRVLCLGGTCILKLPNAGSPWGGQVFASDLSHEAAYSGPSIAQLAKLADFSQQELREVCPPPGTYASLIRSALWRMIRAAYSGVNLIETGSGLDGVYTQVMLVRLVA